MISLPLKIVCVIVTQTITHANLIGLRGKVPAAILTFFKSHFSFSVEGHTKICKYNEQMTLYNSIQTSTQ